MRIAIVHDELVRKGGAEQVVLSFHKTFPDAPIYTLTYNEKETYPEFKSCNIKTSWFGRFIKDDKNLKRFFFPFGIMAMKQLDVTGYDVVLQSTTHCSKYVKVDKDAVVITYCHTPFRLVFRPHSYDEVASANTLKKKLYDFVIGLLRRIDIAAAKRTDWFIANAHEVVSRIVTAYHPNHKVTVINPPVKCRNFFVASQIENYYLVVSRFEAYKRVDLVIDAFNQLPEKRLIIVGSGSMEEELKRKAGPNVKFMTSVNSKELADIYARAKALIFPQHEDYGITPLEANASGRPVIAFGKGGVLDTMVPVTTDTRIPTTEENLSQFRHNERQIAAEKATALFFEAQTVECLVAAIETFETLSFNPAFIRAHAEKYDESTFIEKIRSFILEKSEAKYSKANESMSLTA